MKTIKINDQVALTEIAMGALHPKNEDSPKIMDRYFEAGGRVFDSARHYFAGEYDAFLGNWIKERRLRDLVTYCAKGCHPADASKMYLSRLSKEEIKGDLELSLKTAGIEQADLYLLHRDNPRLPVEDIILAMNELVKEGKTKVIGVSNWTAMRIAKANAFAKENGLTPFSVCQLHYSLAQTTPAATVDVTHVPMNNIEYDWFLSNDFPVMAFSSQAKGFFSQMESGVPLKETVKKHYSYFPENLRRAERAAVLAKKHGVTGSAIALAYLLANPLRASALVGFSSMAQFEQSIKALSVNLSSEEVRYLETGLQS